jgi:hypothetical protein
MGGMNHQPCNRFLGRSTQMSRALSVLGISLEKTNIELEDALLSEMKGHKPSLAKMLEACDVMKKKSSAFLVSVETLRKQMDELYYEDLQSVKSEALDISLANLIEAGLAEKSEVDKILTTMRNGSFYSVLYIFTQYTKSIDVCICDLEKQTKLCSDLSKKTGLEKQLEGNLEGNLRVPFAKLYTSWHKLHRLFLASSMVSTDAYYLSIGVDTLVSEKETESH